ncbi:unnamed protein product [Rotaria sordida]|uniref:Uncharacterized protein n=1 Tax=Rotaria sordida TaxID=392033 RepID=A0A819E391_9BILA|nr:unnamed protein product [Rotaria sordida]CAF3843496.1 unnamed protein product [Rotaria sordida]
MAEGGGSSRRDGKRYTDLSNEPDKPLPPLQKFTNQPVPQLQDAVKSIHKITKKAVHHVLIDFSKYQPEFRKFDNIEQWCFAVHMF